jgi:chemotaxis protein methyltransferase CheR
MSQILNQADLEKLTDLIRGRTGLSVSDTKREDVIQAFKNLLVTHRLTGLPALFNSLNMLPVTNALWQELIDIITVGETYFFRNPDQFAALRSEVLPALVHARRASGHKYLRVWCAGCATGEEPYSLAIMLHELLPDFQAWQIMLLATDINVTSLERAKRGLYRSWSFRNETPTEIQRWFKRNGETYELDSAIRNMVVFTPLNLVSDIYPSIINGVSHLDLILCRNVTIYFDQDTTRQIIGRFYESLTDNGWLIVGHSEPTTTLYQAFTPCNFPNTIFYQKPAHAQRNASAPIGAAPSVTRPSPIAAALPVRSTEVQKEPKAPQTKPLPTLALWEQAKAAADQERWQDALVLLATAEAENKFQPQVFYLRAMVQLHLDDASGAQMSLRQALYCDPQFVLAHYTLGELYQRAGDYKNAARCWKTAETLLAPLDPQAHLPFGEDLTVEMLQGLIAFAGKRLPQDKGTN